MQTSLIHGFQNANAMDRAESSSIGETGPSQVDQGLPGEIPEGDHARADEARAEPSAIGQPAVPADTSGGAARVRGV